jgi:Transglycosylase SLT domain
MRRARNGLPATLQTVVMAITLCGVVSAQSTGPAPAPDVFSAWQANLNAAADKALAAAVADKPWMRASETVGSSAGSPWLASGPLVRVRAAIRRVQQLRPAIEPILLQEGVPAELSAIVLVESGGQPTALSPKGARGIWQFMPATARHYGLVVGPEKDERVDVLKSTRAAARYLRDLHDRFDSWPLVLAAYDAGEDVVRRAIERTGASDFVELGRALPPETRDYVPAVIAAARRFGDQSLFTTSGVRQSKSRVVYASDELAY